MPPPRFILCFCLQRGRQHKHVFVVLCLYLLYVENSTNGSLFFRFGRVFSENFNFSWKSSRIRSIEGNGRSTGPQEDYAKLPRESNPILGNQIQRKGKAVFLLFLHTRREVRGPVVQNSKIKLPVSHHLPASKPSPTGGNAWRHQLVRPWEDHAKLPSSLFFLRPVRGQGWPVAQPNAINKVTQLSKLYS